MRTTRHAAQIIGLVLIAPVAWAEFPTSQPFTGVMYQQETRSDPPMRLFVAVVDLASPKVHVRTTPGGPDPDGPGEWETTLMTPTTIAAREKFDLVVNGDFFAVRAVKDAGQTKPAYRPDVWAGAIGPAVTDGRTWSVAKERTPCLVVYKNRKAAIEPVDSPPADAWAVVAGNVMLVEDGKALPQTNQARHPRTVAGVDKKGTKLTLLVVDGRRPGTSIGMTYEDLAKEMVRLGCWRALNLDGGGSSVMAMREPATGKYKILNTPSDGRERPVANVLGVRIDGGPREKSMPTAPEKN
ncbi:MAG: phosphodiester glycosidase family protein [Planctomycetes bacterium]|nr:phosphodiester glycosidase family protein [Planctomycetota bacterium]